MSLEEKGFEALLKAPPDYSSTAKVADWNKLPWTARRMYKAFADEIVKQVSREIATKLVESNYYRP
jgi:hypothetical protein